MPPNVYASSSMVCGACAVLFVGILVMYVVSSPSVSVDGFDNRRDSSPAIHARCPNLLIQKGTQYFLYNTHLAPVPGVNPVQFASLEEYTEFLDWQKQAGIRCPVLYVQQVFDAQGNRMYKPRPSVTELQGGIPPTPPPLPPMPMKSPEPPGQTPTTDTDPQQYPSFNQSSYYIGESTPLDLMQQSKENALYSDNPMDPNWGGAEYTQSLLDAGYYKGNEVDIRVA